MVEIFKKKFSNRSLTNPHLTWRSFFNHMFTSRWNYYITFLVAKNTFSLLTIDSQISLRLNMNITFPLRFSYLPSKNHQEFENLMAARAISTSNLFANSRGKLLHEVIKSNRDITYLLASNVFLFSIIFLNLLLTAFLFTACAN